MAGPTPFEMAKMNGGSTLSSGEFAVKEIGAGLVALERLDRRPSRARKVWRGVLVALAVAAVALVVVMPMIVR